MLPTSPMPNSPISRKFLVQVLRKELARRSIRAFCVAYLGKHFTAAFGEHHEDLFALIDSPGKNKRICRAEPRGFGKSTVISLALPLWMLAYRRKHFPVLVGATDGMAAGNLATIIEELETNDLLLEDFPHLEAAKDSKGRFVKWTDHELAFMSGARIIAKGMGATVRGLKRNQFRPDLAILDDPETPEKRSDPEVERNKRWFGGTFMGLGALDWDVYVIGNLVNERGLIAHLLTAPDWDSKLYKAENLSVREDYPYPYGNTKRDGSALWEAGWPIERLHAKRRELVVASDYAREYLNEPTAREDQVFNSSQFTFFDYEREHLREYDLVVSFLDPAGGQKPGEFTKGKRDFAAIVTIGRLKLPPKHTPEQVRKAQIQGTPLSQKAPQPKYLGLQKLEVIDVRLTKDLPDKQIDLALDVYSQFSEHGGHVLGIEDNIFKNFMAPVLRKRALERGLYPKVVTIHQISNKPERINSIQPLVVDGSIRFARHLLRACPEYFSQFDMFPNHAHDDGPDATEGAVRLTERKAGPRVWGGAA